MTPVRFLLRFLFWLVLGVGFLAIGELLFEKWGAMIRAAKQRAKELD